MGLFEHHLRHINGFARISNVERLVGTAVVENEQVRTLNHRHANAPVKQCVHVGFGQLTNGAIEKLYHIVAGMVARELIVGHKSAGAQAVLLAKNYGLFMYAQGRIHFGVRYSPLAQTAVGTSFARRLGMQFIAHTR